MHYTIDDIFNRLGSVGQVKVGDKIYKVSTNGILVVFVHGKSTLRLGKSELYNRWGIGDDGKLFYFRKNLVTRENKKVPAEIQ